MPVCAFEKQPSLSLRENEARHYFAVCEGGEGERLIGRGSSALLNSKSIPATELLTIQPIPKPTKPDPTPLPITHQPPKPNRTPTQSNSDFNKSPLLTPRPILDPHQPQECSGKTPNSWPRPSCCLLCRGQQARRASTNARPKDSKPNENPCRVSEDGTQMGPCFLRQVCARQKGGRHKALT
jgi:hypothetical protein